ncbi:MAG: hypothetical protein NZ959_07760 [Armatimonadetes bacterium]|nr:hypothetical protein [Armatimonadota bacterium]MDW8121680.1 hypothetical protein [Armatimonadota bacterium]
MTAALVLLGDGSVQGQRLPGDYINDINAGYVTPHIPWAKPYGKGKIEAFFIVPWSAAREVAELAQRLDLVVFGETTFSERSLGAKDPYSALVWGTSPEEKAQALRKNCRNDMMLLSLPILISLF